MKENVGNEARLFLGVQAHVPKTSTGSFVLLSVPRSFQEVLRNCLLTLASACEVTLNVRAGTISPPHPSWACSSRCGVHRMEAALPKAPWGFRCHALRRMEMERALIWQIGFILVVGRETVVAEKASSTCPMHSEQLLYALNMDGNEPPLHFRH